ncbi:MAG TPA: PDZ domain-containing protein [Gemmatimonadales bacterium]|nr:PDZ domain-containing protein [Gemmatimonadales bacterium]
MMRKSVLAVLAVATITPLLGAQEPPRPRRTPRPDARTFSFSYSGNRARIGVLVNTTANSETDRLGAKIDGVTPGGPAEKAGLKAGDIITRFNGTSLAGARADVDESGPGHKLIELVGALDAGDTVRVDYRRGSETKTTSIVTDEQHQNIWSGDGPMIAQFDQMKRPMTLMQEGFGFCFGDAWCDLDLVTVSPDLGEYFGTREGILVVRAASDSALPLKGGDVILSIGSRKPTSPAHAMRILRSYDEGESVSIEIMRHERRQTINWTVPVAESGWRRRDPRGRGEQSFWRVQPDIEALTAPAMERQMEEVQRSMRELLRSQERLRSEPLRALRSMLRRSSTAL